MVANKRGPKSEQFQASKTAKVSVKLAFAFGACVVQLGSPMVTFAAVPRESERAKGGEEWAAKKDPAKSPFTFGTEAVENKVVSRITKEPPVEGALDECEMLSMCKVAIRTAGGDDSGELPYVLMAMAFEESRFDPSAANGNCVGLVGVSTKWHADRAEKYGLTDFYDPQSNLIIAGDFLLELEKKYDGDMGAVLMYYNGDSKLSEYLSGKEQSRYAKRVIAEAASFEQADRDGEFDKELGYIPGLRSDEDNFCLY